MKIFSVLFYSVFIVFFSASCEKSSESDREAPAEEAATDETDTTPTDPDDGTGGIPDDETDDITDTGSLNLDNALTTAFPDSLAISVFPESVDATASQAGTINTSLTADVKNDSLREKIDVQKAILNGTADSCIPEALKADFQSKVESCYEFDQDMIYSEKETPLGEPTIIQGTKDGKSSTGEACLVSFARAEVDQVVGLVDQTTGFVQAAICQAKKTNSDVELPAIGESIQLVDALKAALGNKVGIVTKAQMRRLPDVNGRPIYRTEMVLKDGDGRGRTITVAHSPKADGTNDTYDGRIALVMQGDVGNKGININDVNEKKRVLSVQYARVYDTAASEYRIRYELRTARMAPHIADIAFDKDILNLNASTNGSFDYLRADNSTYPQANQAVEAIKFVSFDMNPDTNAGTISYWRNPGGRYDENARGLVFDLKHDANGNFKGCANSGSATINLGNGLSIRKALQTDTDIQPAGFWHPFFNTLPNGNCGGITIATPGAPNDSYSRLCLTPMPDNANREQKWFVPDLVATATAIDFVTKDADNLITRQCYIQNKTSGMYEIDTTEITENAGYELITNGDTTKVVRPPQFDLPPPKPGG